MRTSYVLRAREESLSGTTHFFLVATQGSLSLFPDNSSAVMAGTFTCLIFGTIALLVLYFLLNLILPTLYVATFMVPAAVLVIYKSRSWIIMNAARFVRQTTHVMEAQVKEKTLGTFSHELTVDAEGAGHILRFRSLPGTINSALKLAGQDSTRD
jgi:hypothetical protein